MDRVTFELNVSASDNSAFGYLRYDISEMAEMWENIFISPSGGYYK